MKSKNFIFLLLFFTLVLTSCKQDSQQSEIDRINAKMDSTYLQVADLTIEQMKLTTKYVQLPRVTAAIEAYSKAATISDKINIVDAFTPNEQNKADACDAKATPRGHYIIYDRYDEVVNPQSFDLAIRDNDVAIQQIKLMNNHFHGLNQSAIDAIAFYETLSNKDKEKYFFSQNYFSASPDFFKKWLGREVQRTYVLQRTAALEQLNQHLARRTRINEFPQGFKQNNTLSALQNEKQFDLSFSKK